MIRCGARLVEFGGVGALEPADVAGELDRRPLHAVADAEVGDAVAAGELGGAHHAAGAAVAEAAGHQDAGRAFEQPAAGLGFERLGLDPLDVDLQPVRESAVVQRLVEALVGVLVAGVLAHDMDGELVVGVLDVVDQRLPGAHVADRCRQPEPLQHHPVGALVAQLQRHLVDRVDVAGGDHRFLVDVAEQRDLLLQVAVEAAVGAAQQQIGLDADRAQVADAVLGRLGLQLAGRADERHQRQVDVERVLLADVLAELADGLEERQALDVADGAADLHQDHVDVAGHGADAVLDLVGDVRDDLNGAAEVVAAPLLLDDRHVDLAGGPVAVAGGDGVGEALVVAQVEVGLGAVVGDEHLAVLVRAHRARVDVDVGVELEQRHLVAVAFEQRADRGGGEALAERRDDAAGDEDVLGGPGGLGHD